MVSVVVVVVVVVAGVAGVVLVMALVMIVVEGMEELMVRKGREVVEPRRSDLYHDHVE